MWTIALPTTVLWIAIAAVGAFRRSPLALILTFGSICVIEAALVHFLAQGCAQRARVASTVAAAMWILLALAFATYGFAFLAVVGLFAGIATLLTLAFTLEYEYYVYGGLLPALYFIADRLAGATQQIRFDLLSAGHITPVVHYCTSTYSWFIFDATILFIAGVAMLATWVFRRLGLVAPPLASQSGSAVFFATVAVSVIAGSAVKATVGSAFSVVSAALTGFAYSLITRPSTMAASRRKSITIIGILALLAVVFGAVNGWVSWHDWQFNRWCP